MDEEYKQLTRDVATIPSFFSAVGGFMTVTFTIAGLVLFRI